MSYFDDASLVMIPSGYKDQKVYSVKPIDGSGDLTFSRASNASRINSSGLVEKVRTNYLFNSETFSSWATEGGTLTGGFSDPDGGLTAYKYVQTTGGLYSNIAATDSLPKITSVYLKSVDGTSYNVTLGNGSAGNLTVATVTPTWQRFTNANTASSTRLALYIYAIGNAGGVMVWHPQGEYGDIPTDYIATTSSAVSVGPVSGLPRLDYSGGATCCSLLLEPQRTNAALWSEQFDNAAWTKTASTTITANANVSPSGYQDADTYTTTAIGSGSQIYRVIPVSGTTQTLSIFVKYLSGSGTNLRLSIGSVESLGVNLTFSNSGATLNGVKGSSVSTLNIENYGNNWFRVSISVAYASAFAEYNLFRYAGSGTDAYAIWGAQLEADSSYATSYIPTLSTAVTRVAESASKTGISSLIGQTEGTLFVDFTINGLQDFGTPISVNDGTTSNYIWFTIFSNGNLRVELNNGTVQSAITYGGAVVGGRYKMAFGYKTNDFALYVNGAQIGTDNSGTTFSGTTLSRVDTDITDAATYSTASESINQALLFTTRLTNAQLAELTTL